MHAFQKINERFLVLSQSEAVKNVVSLDIQFFYIKESEYT
jgi:hypothetical protein